LNHDARNHVLKKKKYKNYSV